MHGSRKFFQRGSNFFYVFFVCFFFSWVGERGSKYHYKRAIIGPPAKRHLNGVSLAGRWWPNTACWLVSFVVLQGIRTNTAKKPYIFVIFLGGGGGGGGGSVPSAPLWICVCFRFPAKPEVQFHYNKHGFKVGDKASADPVQLTSSGSTLISKRG